MVPAGQRKFAAQPLAGLKPATHAQPDGVLSSTEASQQVPSAYEWYPSEQTATVQSAALGPVHMLHDATEATAATVTLHDVHPLSVYGVPVVAQTVAVGESPK